MNHSKETPKAKSNLAEFMGSPQLFEAYEKCSNNSERVQILYNSPPIQALFKQQKEVLKNSDSDSCKNDRESKRLRELGNKAFTTGRDSKALELYSEAVVYADQSSKENTFALALANRSAVLARLGHRGQRRALADIRRALTSGHPSPAKLLERKLSCLIDLKLFKEVTDMK